MEHANIRTIEDVINTLDAQYRISAYLKLRGHISYKAARTAGMYLAKRAKEHMTQYGLEGAAAFRTAMSHVADGGIDSFNDYLNETREAEVSEDGVIEMGLGNQDDMLNTIHALVQYANKLNFDLQELFDPTETKRADPHYKQNGVYFTEEGEKQSWTSSVALVASADDKPEMTYAQYKAAVENPDWLLTEAEFNEQSQNDNSLFDEYKHEIVDLLLSVGHGEIDFCDLPLRTQIAAIENMRGKIDSCVTSALKSVKYSRSENKLLESSTVKGIIKGWDKAFCEMLDAPKFAHLAEFMYNYVPGSAVKKSAGITRKIINREPAPVKMNDAQLKAHESKLKVDHMHDLATLENDML